MKATEAIAVFLTVVMSTSHGDKSAKPKSKPSPPPSTTTTMYDPVTLFAPGIDARQEIRNYNSFMDEIFNRMNAAIKAKNLDPMDLKLLPQTNQTTGKIPRIARLAKAIMENRIKDFSKVKGWLYGMSSLKRKGDVSIRIQGQSRTIQVPFALGPLELKVAKTVGEGKDKKTKSAKAVTDLMLGLMDMTIDRQNNKAEITNVIFDEPGGVDIQGSLKRRATNKANPYKLVLASKSQMNLKKVARLVVISSLEGLSLNKD